MVISCICSWLFANTAAIKSHAMLHHFHHVLADSSHKLCDLQHFMSEHIDLHVFKAITVASCVDIIINKHLNKYN